MTTGHRATILKALHSAGGTATLDEISDIGLTRKQLHDNLKAAIVDQLVERIKDVTGLPAYKLTDKGHARRLTISKPAAKQGNTSNSSNGSNGSNGSEAKKPPAGGGENNTPDTHWFIALRN
jgi:hypothetical protein